MNEGTNMIQCQNYNCGRPATYFMQVLQYHGYTVAVCEQCAKDEAENLGVAIERPHFIRIE